VALSAAAATPVLASVVADALVGTTLDEQSVATAAELVTHAASPIDDGRGSRTHRLAVLPVLVRRVVGIAKERAEESQGR